MINEKLIRRLCTLTGIADAYRDHREQPRAISTETLAALLAARGFEVKNEQALRQAIDNFNNRPGDFRVPSVVVIREGQRHVIELEVPLAELGNSLVWRLESEDLRTWSGSLVPEQNIIREHDAHAVCGLEMELPFQPGYHQLFISGKADEPAHRVQVIMAPAGAYSGPAEESAQWGVAVQLYTLKSKRNWGIGDFGDLKALATALAGAGADFLGVNPLHSLYPSNPEHASPYSPASRTCLNYLYIDVEAVPEFQECTDAQEKVASDYLQARLDTLRDCQEVDYSGVAFLKLVVLRQLWEHFTRAHLGKDSSRARQFLEFEEQGGETLRRVSLFYALYADNRKASRQGGWHNWPEELRSPESAAVADFAAAHCDTVRFYSYLQWLADEQLRAAQEAALAAGMTTGLYRDLAVGIDADGADMWRNQSLYCHRASVGAPPDAIALQGQDWGLPPMEPRQMQAEAYQTFIEDLRENMRHCGALRLDHVMQLTRLWWTPAGLPSSEGAYVRYPLDDLLGIVALESHRNRCRVVGEDLGVVPKDIRVALPRENIFSYKVALFEKAKGGAFKPPLDYSEQAMAVLTTHDLPTLAGYWSGKDLLLREELGLYPSVEAKDQAWRERIADRQALVEALKHEQLYPQDLPDEANKIDELPDSLLIALERFLARTRCRMICAQLEDWMGVKNPVNLPGTGAEYPNWRRRLPEHLEDLLDDGRLATHGAALQRSAEAGQPTDAAPETPQPSL